MMSNFEFECRDIDLHVSVKCSQGPLGGWPNQADLRQALDKLLCSLGNWEDVEIKVKKCSLREEESLPEFGVAVAHNAELT